MALSTSLFLKYPLLCRRKKGKPFFIQSVSVTVGGVTPLLVEGKVRQVNVQSGLVTVDAVHRGRITVTIPYNARSNDVSRFQSLRSGDYVRLYGTVVNSGQVQLTQFY